MLILGQVQNVERIIDSQLASVKVEMVWQLSSSDLDAIVLRVVWCAVCGSISNSASVHPEVVCGVV